jgi:hypothetical protein
MGEKSSPILGIMLRMGPNMGSVIACKKRKIWLLGSWMTQLEITRARMMKL